MAYRELKGSNGPMVQWTTVGQVVEGRLVGHKNGKVFNGRQSRIAVLRADNGVEIAVPQTTVLEDRFNEVQPGARVRITFTGLGKGQGGPQSTKMFTFEVDDSVAGQPLPASVSQPAVASPPPGVQPMQAPAAVAPAQPAAPATGTKTYDEYVAMLRVLNPAGAEAIINALLGLYPDQALRTVKLIETLRQQGAQV